ncbi:MmcQ/YjbR family DNA-binding protein [Desertihabitans aurantiacus]|uniref:MmcQ/YjbR family DNA-binding protein n=1 Tax=Desertihabitans aurantiacus TaxID=2282477 RepID=UPI001E29E459|nr:MmcQ/YjbR family DNA-binding protein [Desertihabitans aurantiacus]
MAEDRPATVEDLRRCAGAMPHVTVQRADTDRPVYQVGGKSFVFFRTPSPDAVDPETGERYDDVIVLWVASEEEKQVLLAQPGTPLFTTPHFDGHRSVLLRGCDVGRFSRQEVFELVADAWLSQASRRRARAWLDQQGLR